MRESQAQARTGLQELLYCYYYRPKDTVPVGDVLDIPTLEPIVSFKARYFESSDVP